MKRAFVFDAVAFALAAVAVFTPWPRGWIENAYANGIFAAFNRTFVLLSNRVQFAVGDLEAIVAIAALVVWWVRALRRAPRGRRTRTVFAMLIHTAGWLAAAVVAFEVLWGANYRRETVTARIAFDEHRVNATSVAAFSRRVVDILNRDVGAAHAETLDRERLRAAFEPVAARLGDRWDVAVTIPKATLLEPYYEAAGIGGMYSPFAFETLLNTDFLPFEVPRALAHEWSHAAGFTDEGDANYIGTLTCLRSDDPLIRYSGAFWTYGDLPESERSRLRLDPRVIADFNASRQRFLRHYMPQVFAIQWHFYDSYLRTSGVHGGVASYGNFLRLLVGTELDAQGLPNVRSER